MKEIIPNKLIISLNEDGTVANSLLHYRMRIDGKMENNRFYTMSVKTGINVADLLKISKDSISHAEKGEKIVKEK